MINTLIRAFYKAKADGIGSLPEAAKWELWKRFGGSIASHEYNKIDLLKRKDLQQHSVISKEYNQPIPYKGKSGFDYPNTKYYPGDRSVSIINDARIAGPKGFTVDSNNQCVVDCVGPPIILPRRPTVAIKAVLYQFGILEGRNIIRGKTEPTRNVQTAVHLLPLFNNYYHWTIENVCKLYMVSEFAKEYNFFPPVIVPESATDWMMEFFNFLPECNIIEFGKDHINVNFLIVPTFPDPTHLEIEWLRSRFDDYLEPGNERLLLLRKDANTRRIHNSGNVVNLVSKYGFKPVIPSELSIKEQAQLFSQAECIIGVHGAGLTNIIWPEQTSVIELTGVKSIATYSRLSEICGHDYQRINCDSIGPNVIVDLDSLEASIQNNV